MMDLMDEFPPMLYIQMRVSSSSVRVGEPADELSRDRSTTLQRDMKVRRTHISRLDKHLPWIASS